MAIEAQAAGTPVVAADVGGLTTAVADGVSGLLIPTHDPADWADAIAGLLGDRARLELLGVGAAEHASRFGWDATVDATLAVYAAARAERLTRADGPSPVAAPAGGLAVAP